MSESPKARWPALPQFRRERVSKIQVLLLGRARIMMKETYNYMEWSTPQFQEVCLSCEISSYASPEI